MTNFDYILLWGILLLTVAWGTVLSFMVVPDLNSRITELEDRVDILACSHITIGEGNITHADRQILLDCIDARLRERILIPR